MPVKFEIASESAAVPASITKYAMLFIASIAFPSQAPQVGNGPATPALKIRTEA